MKEWKRSTSAKLLFYAYELKVMAKIQQLILSKISDEDMIY